MRSVDVPPTLIVGYGLEPLELLGAFVESLPAMRDLVFSLDYKPRLREAVNVFVMSPFVRTPVPHILDVLDPFNVGNIAGRFEVAIIATDDRATVATGKLLEGLGVETYYFDGEKSVPISEIEADPPEGERILRRLGGFYVIPGYGKEIFPEAFRRVPGGYITNTGCIVAETPEDARRILREQSSGNSGEKLERLVFFPIMRRPDIEYIRETYELIKPYIVRTPEVKSLYYSRVSGAEVFLKLESLQVTGSFKARGAFNKILRNLEAARKHGVVAASTGNHGQAVAYASSTLGAKATIVMPETAPQLKINRIRRFGGEVMLHGRIFDEAAKKAIELSERENKVFVHPFDDPDVIAGQGTIGLEIAALKPDVVIVPVGGGGLISGVSIAVKALSPGTKIVGVQSEKFPHAYLKRASSRGIEPRERPGYSGDFILADGIAVKEPGEITSEIIAELVDDFVLVDDDELIRAIYTLAKRDKVISEGAGAAPAAALEKLDLRGKRVVLIISGGNVDPPALMEAVIRGLREDGRMFYLKFRGPADALKKISEHHALALNACMRKLPVSGLEFSGYVVLGTKEDFDALIEDLKAMNCEIFE